MKRSYLLLVLCWLYLPVDLWGQSTSGIILTVTDSIKRSPLSGARVTMISGRDTLSIPTNERGVANIQHTFRWDTMLLQVSHLGYETKQVQMSTPKSGAQSGLFIALVESPKSIAEIIVVGKAVAVVVKGDTVQFNAEAFKTFANDPMASLFAVLPGMKIENGNLSYLGQPIDRLTIDGHRLFGNHLGMAMANIRADDVVDVQVFKEASDQDKLDNIVNPRLQTVVDVRTKSKPTLIRSTKLSAAGGATLNPPSGFKGGRSGLYEGSGELIYTKVGKTVSAGAKASNIWLPSGTLMGEGMPVDQNKDYRTEKAHFLFSREEVNKYQISTKTEANLSEFSKENWEARSYFPSADYSTRTYRNERITRDKKKDLSSDNRFQYTFTNRDVLGGNLNLSYSDKNNTTTNQLSAMQDEASTQQQRITSGLGESAFTVSTSTSFSKKLKTGRLNITGAARISNQDGDGWRIDTLSSSTSQVFLEDTHSGNGQKYDARLISSHILSKTLNLSLADNMVYANRDSRRVAVDRMTDEIDLSDSYEYQLREFSNQLAATLSYTNNSQKKGVTQMNASLDWEHKNMQRTEELPRQTIIPRKLNLFRGSLSMKYSLSAFNDVNLSYRRTTTHDFSPLGYIELNVSNPLMISVANPNLTAASDNDFSAKAAFVKDAGTYELAINYSYIENTIVDRARYFAEETYLPLYNYTAMAGSTIVTLENLSGKQMLRVSGNYNVHAWSLQSNIKLGMRYNTSRTPAYVNDQRTRIDAEGYGMVLDWIGNFSSKLIPSINSTTSYSERNNGFVRNEWITQALTLSMRALLFNKVELGTTNLLNWEFNRPQVSGVDRFGIVSSLVAAYLFDQDGNLKLSISADDILNKRQRTRLTVEDEYLRSTYSYNLGRYIILRLNYKF